MNVEQKQFYAEEAKKRFVIKAASDVSFGKIMDTFEAMTETIDIFPMRSILYINWKVSDPTVKSVLEDLQNDGTLNGSQMIDHCEINSHLLGNK